MSLHHLIKLLLILSLVLLGGAPKSQAQSTSGREFLMSCSYGVLAGTLVGTASLAFEDQPGDKLYRIARGASLGLYSGILLGLYVVYVVPKQMDREKERRLRDSLGMGIAPSLNPYSHKIDGASLQVSLFNF